jgi:hypothetical protein
LRLEASLLAVVQSWSNRLEKAVGQGTVSGFAGVPHRCHSSVHTAASKLADGESGGKPRALQGALNLACKGRLFDCHGSQECREITVQN